jgi:hypothetical protein
MALAADTSFPLSVGVARFDPKHPITLSELMVRRIAMYERKRKHQAHFHQQDLRNQDWEFVRHPMGKPSLHDWKEELRGASEDGATYVMIGEDWFLAEQSTTADVSPPALVNIANCKPGEMALVATPTTRSQVKARVVYCETLRNGNFSVGLEFRPEGVDWGK